jgi:hypothetical protein
MTESSCLHIQDRESGPIRVVELPWSSVRIGRAAHCEVRLTQDELADEICRLQRRGQSWRLLPGSIESPVFLAGRRLSGPCSLPFDIPFRVGEYCLTLRRDRAAEPDWDLYAGPAPPHADHSQRPPVAEDEPDIDRSASPLLEANLADSPSLEAGPSGRASCVQTHIAATDASMKSLPAPARPVTARPRSPRATDFSSHDSRERWETRWKALGAQVKARAESNRTAPDLKRPAYQSDLKPVPLREPRIPVFQPPLLSSPGQAAAYVPTADPHGTGSLSLRERAGVRAPLQTTAAKLKQVWPVKEPSVEEPSVERFRVEKPRADEPRSEEALSEAALEAIVRNGEPEKPIAAADGPASRAEQTGQSDEPSPVAMPAPRAKKAVRRVRRDRAPIEDDGDASPLAGTRDTSSHSRQVEWPSAKDILASHAASSNRLPATGGLKANRKKAAALATPTLPLAPACWAAPVWLAGPAAALFVVLTGVLGCGLSWFWAQDSYMASIVIDRLLTSDRTLERSPLPESVGPPQGGWKFSTAGHLAQWAIFLGRFAGEENQRPAETAALLERALSASPINPAARLALAQLEPARSATDVSVRSLGLSRDAVSLAWTARRLLAGGKKEDALKLYGRALKVAVPVVCSRSPVPGFIEDPGIRRYLLPGEEQVRDIVADLVETNAWTFAEWSGSLPEAPIVLIATARLLREKGRGEADTVLDRLLENKAIADAPGEAAPVALAAKAEAFALRSRWKEADQLYRQAIDSIGDPTIARSWWFNLADISFRSDDESQRQAALRSASAVASSDEITRRAAEIQRATSPRSYGVKAN